MKNKINFPDKKNVYNKTKNTLMPNSWDKVKILYTEKQVYVSVLE